MVLVWAFDGMVRWEKQAQEEQDTQWVDSCIALLNWLKEAESEDESDTD